MIVVGLEGNDAIALDGGSEAASRFTNAAKRKLCSGGHDRKMPGWARSHKPATMGVNDTLVFWANSFGELEPEYEPPAQFLQVPTQFSGIEVLHPGFVPRAHELDMFVHIWTINDEEEMRFLIETYGVDGIMTDYPSRLTKVINELGVGD